MDDIEANVPEPTEPENTEPENKESPEWMIWKIQQLEHQLATQAAQTAAMESRATHLGDQLLAMETAVSEIRQNQLSVTPGSQSEASQLETPPETMIPDDGDSSQTEPRVESPVESVAVETQVVEVAPDPPPQNKENRKTRIV